MLVVLIHEWHHQAIQVELEKLIDAIAVVTTCPWLPSFASVDPSSSLGASSPEPDPMLEPELELMLMLRLVLRLTP